VTGNSEIETCNRAGPLDLFSSPTKGVKEKHHEEIKTALFKVVESLNSSSIKTTSCHVFGKLIARAARLALIAGVCFYDGSCRELQVHQYVRSRES
jgi:endo-1,3(4)-beta-glucanase